MILIIDDMPICREPIAACLKLEGFAATCAATGQEGLELARKYHPELILLDMSMPGMDGLQFLSALRADPAISKTPVFLLTAVADRDVVVKAAQFGIQGYLLKSRFSSRDLVSRIRDHLGTKVQESSGIVVSREKSAIAEDEPTAPSGTARQSSATKSASSSETAGVPASMMPVAELLKSLKPIITREQVLEQVDRCAELKALSPTVAQLLQMTSSADCSLDQIARVIKRDQAIALKVLKVANSVVYSRGEPVETVQKSLARIGVSQIRQVVLNISVIDNFRIAGLGEKFNSKCFWEHSIATGLIAAAISRIRRCDDRQIDACFTMGLLHDVARMVFAEQLGDMYIRVLEAAARLQLPLEQVETRMLLLNHADLMERVLSAWKFPRAIVEPIGYHHLSAGNIRNLSPQMIEEVSTLALANRLAHALLLGFSGNDTFYPTEEFIRILGLSAADLRFIEEQIPEQVTDMKYAMLQAAGNDPWPDASQMMLKQLKCPFSPIYISSEPDFDAYRILFARLKSSVSDGQPNAGIIHMTDIRQRETLGELLLETEKQNNCDPMPLIIISPRGNLKLSDRVLGNRMHRCLPSPFTFSRLVETINNLIPSHEEGAASIPISAPAEPVMVQT